MQKKMEVIEGNTSMPTNTEMKVRTLKEDRIKNLEDDQPGCFAFCRKLKFWRRRTWPAVPDLDNDQLVTVAAADEGVCQADHVSQLMPVTAGANKELFVPDLVPVTVTVEGSSAASDQIQATGDMEGVPAVSDEPKVPGELEGVPTASNQTSLPLEKDVSCTYRARGLCRPCRLTVAVTLAQRRLVVGRQGEAAPTRVQWRKSHCVTTTGRKGRRNDTKGTPMPSGGRCPGHQE